jgi:hypothetical protein
MDTFYGLNMGIYRDTEKLYRVLRAFFAQIQSENPEAAEAVSKARLILRLRTSDPFAEVTINGRKNPPEITYGMSTLRPDLEVDLSAQALHSILLAELPLGKAVSSRQVKVRGSIWKSFVLEGIFQSGQAIYPQILAEIGPDGLH